MNIRMQMEEREEQLLGPYASFSQRSKGRDVKEEPCPMRTDYQRDRDRILHSNAFRRLTHKTQVFLSPEGDHYRTRLTHTLEVAQVARTIARSLRLNEDLTEAIALGHDLGHTPFGHAGEEVLNRLSPHGYRHSNQSVRVVEVLESNRRGLNLTWEVRNGIACHSSGTPAETREGQVVRYADKIAYMNHDIDDAIRGGILKESDIPFQVQAHFGRRKSTRMTSMITDLVANSGEEIKMSPQGQKLYDELRSFMFQAVYTNPDAKIEEGKAQRVVEQLYAYYLKRPEELPDFYFEIQNTDGEPHRGICDYLSGMSDRYCVALFEKLFVPQPWKL